MEKITNETLEVEYRKLATEINKYYSEYAYLYEEMNKSINEGARVEPRQQQALNDAVNSLYQLSVEIRGENRRKPEDIDRDFRSKVEMVENNRWTPEIRSIS